MKRFIFLLFLFLVALPMYGSKVKVSSYGFDDPTRAIELAMASQYDTLVVDLQAKPWIVRPLRFVGLKNKTILFEKGVRIQAEKGAFEHRGACLIKFIDCENINIIGEGNELAMNKAEYVQGEFRHVLLLRGCKNFHIRNLILRDSGGDGIIITYSKKQDYSENIQIEQVHCINNKRQGITIVSGQNIKVSDAVFEDTIGTLPGAGVDLEPDRPQDRLVNIHFKECIFRNNYHAGVKIALDKLTSASNPVSVCFDNCLITENFNPDNKKPSAEVFVAARKEEPVRGHIEFANCLIQNSQGGIIYARNTLKAISTSFIDCHIRDSRQDPSKAMVEIVERNRDQDSLLGRLEFKNQYLQINKSPRLFNIKNSNSNNWVSEVIKGDIIIKASSADACNALNVEGISSKFQGLNIICESK